MHISEILYSFILMKLIVRSAFHSFFFFFCFIEPVIYKVIHVEEYNFIFSTFFSSVVHSILFDRRVGIKMIFATTESRFHANDWSTFALQICVLITVGLRGCQSRNGSEKKNPKDRIKYIYAKLKNSHARTYTAAKSTSRGLKINTTRLGKFSIMLLAFVVNNVTLPRLVTHKNGQPKNSLSRQTLVSRLG